jgi:hypothetical protein
MHCIQLLYKIHFALLLLCVFKEENVLSTYYFSCVRPTLNGARSSTGSGRKYQTFLIERHFLMVRVELLELMLNCSTARSISHLKHLFINFIWHP